MAHFVNLKKNTSEKGSMVVIEKCIPFEVKRVFYMYDIVGSRGNHSHKVTAQALTCIQGTCKIKVGKKSPQIFDMNSNDLCLIVEPLEWHQMYDFSVDAILMCLSSHEYDPNDFIKD
jgi:hypothetical protein